MAVLALSEEKQTSKQTHSVGSLIQQCASCMIPSGRKNYTCDKNLEWKS